MTPAQIKVQIPRPKVKNRRRPRRRSTCQSFLAGFELDEMCSTSLEQQALKLSAEERAHMIDALWRGLDPVEQEAVDRAWLAESRDRLNAFRAGELRALEGEEAIQSIEADLK